MQALRGGTPRRSAWQVEQEVAFRLCAFARNEFDLSPVEATATLEGGTLRVRMQDALTPMARVIAQSEQGPQILDGVYALLLDAGRSRLHLLVARVVGRPVRRSEMRVHVPQGDVSFVFELGDTPDRP